MNFSWALEQMKVGKRVKRASRKDESSIFLSYPRADSPQFRLDRSEAGDYESADVWVCDAVHALADDWQVVE
jgi:hypothetical protein